MAEITATNVGNTSNIKVEIADTNVRTISNANANMNMGGGGRKIKPKPCSLEILQGAAFEAIEHPE